MSLLPPAISSLRPLATLSLLLLLAGCASAPAQPRIVIVSLVLQNHSSSALDQVRVKVEETGGVVGCGHILQHSRCSTGFPSQLYIGQHLTVSWQQDDQQWRHEGLQVDVGEAPGQGMPATALVIIGDDGEVSIHLSQ